MAKIVIRAEGVRLALHVPLGLCLRLAAQKAGKEEDAFKRFMKAHGREIRSILKQYRKDCGKFALVDIETAGGEKVKIVV